jgi:large subunit ribosomal protein L23
MNDKLMVLKPRVSEKAYALSQGDTNVYVFQVPKGASKAAIASAVSTQFEVTVQTVNTAISKGKSKRTVRKGGRRAVAGRTVAFKKAYVTLKDGDTIAIFKAEEDKKPAAKAAKKEGKK